MSIKCSLCCKEMSVLIEADGRVWAQIGEQIFCPECLNPSIAEAYQQSMRMKIVLSDMERDLKDKEDALNSASIEIVEAKKKYNRLLRKRNTSRKNLGEYRAATLWTKLRI